MSPPTGTCDPWPELSLLGVVSRPRPTTFQMLSKKFEAEIQQMYKARLDRIKKGDPTRDKFNHYYPRASPTVSATWGFQNHESAWNQDDWIEFESSRGNEWYDMPYGGDFPSGPPNVDLMYSDVTKKQPFEEQNANFEALRHAYNGNGSGGGSGYGAAVQAATGVARVGRDLVGQAFDNINAGGVAHNAALPGQVFAAVVGALAGHIVRDVPNVVDLTHIPTVAQIAGRRFL
mmetsp:Transcript_67624/g.188713  ORF Transcript_67624/g.188713 Transcript_67624/m.188713 type:complete len:232 (-) Transcript_67624:70-765(-)